MSIKEIDHKITIGNVCFIQHLTTKRILLLKRKNHPMKNMYTGVGGKTYFEEDIPSSCLREAKEETGLDIVEISLKGILKTVLEKKNSSWILFVYTAKTYTEKCIPCDEGELNWFDPKDIQALPLIGFIREIFPAILENRYFIEGCIHHDKEGEVLQKKIKLSPFFTNEQLFVK